MYQMYHLEYQSDLKKVVKRLLDEKTYEIFTTIEWNAKWVEN